MNYKRRKPRRAVRTKAYSERPTGNSQSRPKKQYRTSRPAKSVKTKAKKPELLVLQCRLKPAVYEAVQFNGYNQAAIRRWCGRSNLRVAANRDIAIALEPDGDFKRVPEWGFILRVSDGTFRVMSDEAFYRQYTVDKDLNFDIDD